MMTEQLILQRLHEACEREFEAYVTRHVDLLFDTYATLPGAGNIYTAQRLPIPLINEPGFFAGLDFPWHREDVRAAMIARERFNRTSPIWSPILPLRQDECKYLQNEDSAQLNVVGYYGASLRGTGWSAEHPCFCQYVGGLLVHEHAPDYIRNDKLLRAEFLPDRLEGLDDDLTWRSPEMIEHDREMEAKSKALEARYEASRVKHEELMALQAKIGRAGAPHETIM
jgi:hypothetical protein